MRKGILALLGLIGLTMSLWAEDPYKMTVLYPGDPSARMTTFLKGEFAAAIKKDLNMEIKVNWSSWGNYWSKLGLVLAAAEPLDWFWDGTSTVGPHVAKKEVQPLDALLKKYGPDLLAAIPAKNWDATKINGKIYGIPSQVSSSSEKFITILGRSDILEAVGVKNITSFDELLAACAKIQAKFPEMGLFATVPYEALLREVAPGWYLRTEGTDKGFIMVNETEAAPTAYSLFDPSQKDKLVKLNNMAKKLVDLGYVGEDVLSDPGNDQARFQSGNYVFWKGAVSRPMESAGAVQKNVPTATLREYYLGPRAPKYVAVVSNETIFVPTSNKHPEKAIQLLNWMVKSQENYDLALFGVKGKDYTIDAAGRMIRTNTDDLWYEWMFRNGKYMRMPTNVSEEFVQDFKNWDKDAKYSKVLGFNFNPDPVKAEWAKIATVASIPNTVVFGFSDISDPAVWADVQKKYTEAGLAKVVAEYSKQLAAYTASKK